MPCTTAAVACSLACHVQLVRVGLVKPWPLDAHARSGLHPNHLQNDHLQCHQYGSSDKREKFRLVLHLHF